MNHQSIDLKYFSGRGIGSLVPFHKPCLYTTVYISSSSTSGPRPHRQKTPTDPDGASNPEWNHPIRLYFDSNDQSSSSDDLILNFDIKTQVPLLGDKFVGSVLVPLSSLASEGPTDALCHVRYQVRGPDGKPNGVLSFSYILNQSPVRVSDPAPAQDSTNLHQGSPYPNFLNDEEAHEVYPPLEKPDSKSQLYPTVDPLENPKPFVYRSLLPDPNPQVYPPPPVPDSKPSLYPVISTEPVIAYPVLDSEVNGYYPPPFASYPKVEPVGGLASYSLPGYHPPPQGSGYCYQERGWDGRCL